MSKWKVTATSYDEADDAIAISVRQLGDTGRDEGEVVVVQIDFDHNRVCVSGDPPYSELAKVALRVVELFDGEHDGGSPADVQLEGVRFFVA